jgi:hypothetical protein
MELEVEAVAVCPNDTWAVFAEGGYVDVYLYAETREARKRAWLEALEAMHAAYPHCRYDSHFYMGDDECFGGVGVADEITRFKILRETADV